MSLYSKEIAKNTSYFTIANILQKIIAFFYVAIISRIIGPSDLGVYTYALSVTSIFGIFIDIGFEKVLIREIAKNKDKAQNFFSNILGIKLPLSFLTLAIIFIITYFQNYPPLTKELIYISAFLMSLDSFNLSMECVLRGFQNLKYESISVVICQIATFVIGVCGILANKNNLKILVIALLIGSLWRFFFALTILIKKYNIYPKLKYDKTILRFLLKISFPFAIAGIFLKIYSYADSVLLFNLAGKTAAGLYGLPYRAVTAFQFIPMAFMAALFPALSFFYVSSKESLKKAFEMALIYLSIICVPIIFGVIVLAKEIILKFFGPPFLPSVFALQILISNLLFIFLDFPAGTVLNACDHERINTILMCFAMVINIISNLILIPKYTFIGASISMIISTLFLVITRLYFSYKISNFDIFNVFIKILKALIAGLVMGIAIWHLKSFTNFYLVIIIGAVIYPTVLYCIRGIEKNDIKLIYESMRHKI
ncbi:MAG: flippase [bacterium]